MDAATRWPHYGRLVIRMRGRGRRLDAALLGFAVVLGVSVLFTAQHSPAAAALVSFAFVAVFCARTWSPLAVTVASFGLQAIGMGLDPVASPLQFVAMLLTFLLAGMFNRGRELAVAALSGIALLAYATLGISTGAGPGDFVLSTFIAMGFFVAGWQVSRRTHLLSAAREDAESAVAEQAERTRQALADERARIARELHDVVSHGLSVVVVQVQAARRGMNGHLPEVTTRLDAVEATAREALGDMRRMLGLLQIDEAEGAPSPPSPGLRDLPALVDRARATGCDVGADLPVEPPEAGTGVQLAAYRIVQESLTNALKHAPGSPISLRVCCRDGSVQVVVRNVMGVGPGRALSGGHGVLGMRERAATYGGRCDVGPTADGFYEVHAVLPLGLTEREGAR